jgi:hypothetical protein
MELQHRRVRDLGYMVLFGKKFQYTDPPSDHGSYVNAPKPLTTTNTVYN